MIRPWDRAFLTAALQELASLPADLRPGNEMRSVAAFGRRMLMQAVYLTKVRLWLEVLPELKQCCFFSPLPGISIGDLRGRLCGLMWCWPILPTGAGKASIGTRGFIGTVSGLLPRQVDLYGYFSQPGTYIKAGAVAAVVTPLAWLEVDYELQDLLQQQLEIPNYYIRLRALVQESAVHTVCTLPAVPVGKSQRSATLVNLPLHWRRYRRNQWPLGPLPVWF